MNGGCTGENFFDVRKNGFKCNIVPGTWKFDEKIKFYR